MIRITDEAAAAVGTRVTGAQVERVERLAGSVGNHDVMLITALGDFVLKASVTQDLAPEVWACERVRRVGVLAPEIVWFEDEPQSLPMPFLVMRRLRGSPAVSESPVLRVAGQQLAAVHSIRVPGYGGLVVERGQARGRCDRWDAFVAQLTSGIDDLVTGRVVSESLAAAVDEAVRSAADELSFTAPAVLLHGDLKLAHIFAGPGGQAGLIDWGDVAAGDPRLDLGRMSMVGSTAFVMFMSGYGHSVTPELNRSLTAYRLLWHLDALVYELRAGGDWFDSYLAGIRASMDELTR